MWDQVFETLHRGAPSAEADLARAEAALGFPLPASYRTFCRDCGAGLAGGTIRIATPLPHPAADLVVRSELIAHSIQAALEGLGAGHAFAVEGGDAGVVDRACFFGEAEDGSFLFWDVADDPESGAPGEFDVWVLAPDLETVRFGGQSLEAFFRSVQGEAVTRVLGPEAEALPARFEGIEAAVLTRGAEL